MALLASFTILDVVITKVGLGFGFIELNAFVTALGVESWVIFRFLLLIYLLVIYFTGYCVLKSRSSRSFSLLKNSLYAVNVYMGAIVFSGFFHILSIMMA
jgi:hypothetical protein